MNNLKKYALPFAIIISFLIHLIIIKSISFNMFQSFDDPSDDIIITIVKSEKSSSTNNKKSFKSKENKIEDIIMSSDKKIDKDFYYHEANKSKAKALNMQKFLKELCDKNHDFKNLFNVNSSCLKAKYVQNNYKECCSHSVQSKGIPTSQSNLCKHALKKGNVIDENLDYDWYT